MVTIYLHLWHTSYSKWTVTLLLEYATPSDVQALFTATVPSYCGASIGEQRSACKKGNPSGTVHCTRFHVHESPAEFIGTGSEVQGQGQSRKRSKNLRKTWENVFLKIVTVNSCYMHK